MPTSHLKWFFSLILQSKREEQLRGVQPPNTPMSVPNFQQLESFFSDLKHSFLQDTHFIRSKMQIQQTTINELHDYLEKIIEKQSFSYKNLRRTILLLCRQLTMHSPQDQTLGIAKQALQEEQERWNHFTSSVAARISRIQGKNIPLYPSSIKRSFKLRGVPVKFEEKNLIDEEVSYDDFGKSSEPSHKPSQTQRIKLEGALSLGNEEAFDYRTNLQEEYTKIREFVQSFLGPMLKYDSKAKIPKKVILNNYLKWNRDNHRKVLIDDYGQIQMELTVQVKHVMDRVISARKIFHGITFKQEYADMLTLTDRAEAATDADLLFEQGNSSDPIDEILKEAKGKDQSVVLSGKQLDHLDTTLGLK